jgi:hypothetical protein
MNGIIRPMCVGEAEKRCPVNGRRYCAMRETDNKWRWWKRIPLWIKAVRNGGFAK